MNFIETRGNDNTRKKLNSFSEVILNPQASFKGLYVPEEIPKLNTSDLEEYLSYGYKKLVFHILKKFNIDISDKDLDKSIESYNLFDNPLNPIPLTKIKNKCFISELYHGPTRAFKDIALQPFGTLFSEQVKKNNKEYLILVATSGDTGPATLESFKNKQNIKVVCLYPDKGTSYIQKLQMTTVKADNIKVIGVEGNFDDTQNKIKELLYSNKSFKAALNSKNTNLSVANSINFGRIIFQIIYHINSYLELLRKKEIKRGDKISLIIPSGNFGNALGAYYAKNMGVMIDKIIISSNENNILTEFIKTGIYDLRDKNFIKTNSPAMDILRSSNIERILFHNFGEDRTKELMLSLEENNFYKLNSKELLSIQEDFDATYSTNEENEFYIKEIFTDNNYLIDPHTATAIKSFKDIDKQNNIKYIIYSTAEWSKFPKTISKAIYNKIFNEDIEAINLIKENMNINLNKNIENIFNLKENNLEVIKKEDIEREILNFI